MDHEGDRQQAKEIETIADLDSDAGDARQRSTIGRYVILDSVGMGGMGVVCAAYDPKLNRRIALKLLRNASTEEATQAGRGRLFREAQALARLSHPNVVTVHDVDVFEGQVYIAMEFVEGQTLRDWLRVERRGWQQILPKFILAGRGLAAAHQADIIHRDFKPANVLISNEGDVRVADFGVAKEHDRPHHDAERERAEFERRRRTAGSGGVSMETTAEDALIEEIQSNVSVELTVAGRMVGTPAYMAPEQHMGLRVGPFTDQYSFCVSLYEALYGRLPYEGTDRRDQLAKMAEGKLSPPPKEGPAGSVPAWLHKILARGLRPHPSERWPSMEQLLAALARDPAKRMRRIGALVAGGMGLAAGLVGLWLGLQPEPEVNHCPALRDAVAEHWSDEQASELEEVFMASSRPFATDAARRVNATLASFAEAWGDTRVEICEASRVGQQSERLLDVRMYCLEQRAHQLDAMIELFIEADDEIVERSVAAAHALGDPRTCASVRDTGEIDDEKLDPAAREQIKQMKADLNGAFALASAEKYRESLPLQARVVARARDFPHERTLAKALYELSESKFETGEVEGGEAALQEAIELAARLGEHELEAQAWTRMIFYLGNEQHRFEAGRAWALAASAALIRAGKPAQLEVGYQSALGALAVAEGKLELAAEHYGNSLELARAKIGEGKLVTVRVMTNYGVVLARLGGKQNFEQAEAILLEAVARSRDVYGKLHPWNATVYLNLGNVYLVAKRLDEAEKAYRKALALREANGGKDAANLANPLTMLAKVEAERGRHEAALVELRRLLGIHLRTKSENSRIVAGVLTDIGVTEQALGRYEDARATFERVAGIYAEIYPDGHPHVSGFERRRCKLFIEAELWEEAVDACDRALVVQAKFEAKLEQQLQVQQLLLEAELGRGRTLAAERVRARIAELELAAAEQAADVDSN